MPVEKRVQLLRDLMKKHRVDAYYVPSADPHQGEYVADCWQRRAFISGFSGSAGTVVVTATKAGLWTDSRYFLQASEELEGSGISLFKMGEPGVPEIEEWLVEELGQGKHVGFDPWMVSIGQYLNMKDVLAQGKVNLVPVGGDLVERVWGDQKPPIPTNPVVEHSMQYAGQSTEDKVSLIREEMAKRGTQAMVVSALDEVAWLLNLRGSDVDFNPVFIAYVVVGESKLVLYIDESKLGEGARNALPKDIVIRPYDSISKWLGGCAKEQIRVWLDPATVNQALADVLRHGGAKLHMESNPIASWKSMKNEAEMQGMVNAHERDGVAMIRFLMWVQEAVPQGRETEMSVAEKVEEFRGQNELFVGMSFNTISGYAGHGAIVHYSVSEESNVSVRPEGLLLVDSGGQYKDGTTDITRTLSVGSPTAEHMRSYTTVLKGHLALGRAWFPEGTNGYQLDTLARAPLWAEGLNYGHGTGHGVGAYLNVHEGPFSVSLRKNMNPLQPGNVLSNEPGYYKAGEYGIRIENLVQVVVKGESESGRLLGFEPLTLCPYERALIDLSMLTAVERRQVDEYHQLVYQKLSARLDEAHRRWLEEATRPL